MNRSAFYLDLLERSLWTFSQALAATWLVTQDFSLLGLKVGAAAGVAAVGKSFVAPKLPWTASNAASTLPSTVVEETAEPTPGEG